MRLIFFRLVLLSCLSSISPGLTAAEVLRFKGFDKPIGPFKAFDKPLDIVIRIPGATTKIPLNRMQSLEIEVIMAQKDRQAVALEFDASMPEHKHGMLVKPVVKALGANKFQVDGVKLHMAGNWELKLKITMQTLPTKDPKDNEVLTIDLPYTL